jgi:2-oxoisovalerate dehydrogenase E2 component (dihydrolipoyl transacylase)
MAEHVIKLPDVGEGIAEAELVEWHVKVGDLVREDHILAAVMTDKATVEIPSPVDGTVTWLGAEVGESVAVGSDLIRLEISADAASSEVRPVAPVEASPKPMPPEPSHPEPTMPEGRAGDGGHADLRPAAARKIGFGAPRRPGERPLATPAVRLRARETGIDLRQVPGTGPAGRITHEDLEAFIAHGPRTGRSSGLQENDAVEVVKVVGLRRRIAEKMTTANARIAAITYVEEVDVEALENLRAALNAQRRQTQPKLTLLPFLMRALVLAIAEQPNLNAHYDDEAGVIHRYGGVHIGIATQTPSGLVVPVVRHAEALDVWECAAEVRRLGDASRAGVATREEMTGSTITITSLGPMGGIVTTPIVNHPEVAILGVNKIAIRPMWDGAGFVPRKMMNLSSSFDHRVIDGWDAAMFVQRIKTLLETPALIFVEG